MELMKLMNPMKRKKNRMGGDRTKGQKVTNIRMSSDLLDDRVIEMARVAQEVPSNIICMFYAFEDIRRHGELRPLSKLGALILALQVDVLHPAVMVGGRCLGDMLLEDDDVGVWDRLRVHRRDDRRGTLMNSFSAEGGCCRSQRQERQADKPTHDEEKE